MNRQITNTTFGNGLTTQYNYNPQNHSLESVQTPNVQDYSYYFEPIKGNLTNRTFNNITENFTYDNLDRLTEVSGYTNLQIDYTNNGNINSMTGLGTYHYDSNRPNAVTSIENIDSIIKTDQNISYTSFNKVDVIEQGDFSLEFTYNSSHERKKTQLYRNEELIKTKYFFGGYEKEITSDGTRELNYISSPDGLVALFVHHSEGSGQMFYLHKDHLGSITEITDQNGDLMQRFYYNPWGVRETLVDNFGSEITDRGFTGHQHLNFQGDVLINMNGRVYDPILGRFLSTDNYIQLPDFSQSFNRYSYGLNNPLKYTDPSGEYAIIDDIIAAAIGGTVNLASNLIQGNIYNLGQGFAAFGAGAVGGVGALYPEFGGWIWGGAVVGATNAWLGGATNATDIITGGIVGAVSSVAGGIAGQYAVSLTNSFLSSIASPVLRGAVSGIAGGVAGGYVGGFAGGYITTGSLIDANKAGLNGMLLGGTFGGVMGAGYGYRFSIKNDINPLTGELNYHSQNIRLLEIEPLVTPEDLLDNFNFEPNGLDDVTYYRGISGNEGSGKLYLTNDYEYAKVYANHYGSEERSITIPRETSNKLIDARLIQNIGVGQHISNPNISGQEFLIQNQALKQLFFRLKP